LALRPLAEALEGFAEEGQAQWSAWRRRIGLEDRLPDTFGDVLKATIDFADPALRDEVGGHTWKPEAAGWRRDDDGK